jgi:mono/diheme cytochrome c family protein
MHRSRLPFQILTRRASEDVGHRRDFHRRIPRLRVGLVWVALAALSLPAAAQDDEESPHRPGLVATYSAAGVSATRTDELLAFDWQDAAPDLRLPAGEFTAAWRGRLWTQTRGTYRLACYVQGQAELKLAGQAVLSGKADQPGWIFSQPLELEFGRHELEITFQKTQPRGQLALYWSGPDFRLEPVPERFLMHDKDQSASADFERGRQLAAALRCTACHQDSAPSASPAPALDRLTGNIEQPWVVEWLSNHAGGKIVGKQSRRMPDLAMTREEATAVAAWLLREPAVKAEAKKIEQKETKVTKEEGKKDSKKKKGEEKPKPSILEGEKLVLTRGCLACHQVGELGESGLFGGGSLTALAAKRPADFLLRWLDDPAAINRSHRMPVFTFTRDEQASLGLWWQELRKKQKDSQTEKAAKELISQGEKLVGTFRCANCHVVARDKDALAGASQKSLTAASDWSRSCGGEPEKAKGRPGYHLAAEDQAALKAYYSLSRPSEGKLASQSRGRDLLVQLNCLACHQREGVDRKANALPATLPDKLVAVAAAHDDLAPLVPAMTPPALNSVGDKLLDAALVDAITRQGPPHRPYLLVQMPRFTLSKNQLADLTAYFTATDRIPHRNPHAPREDSISRSEMPTVAALTAAGPRLVTADGLSCASCHQVGSVQPSKAPLNARGPDISMMEKRIRREWFDRWCDNPARIVPRMEMPAVKVAVRGVLGDKVEDQLAAVWHILNTPGFEPPEPNPVRTLRLSGVPERNERPIVIHDVFKDGDKTWLFPLVIGLPNRHNLLFDLETNRLAAWWLGDTARQRTKGKSWYWETGAKSILHGSSQGMDPVLILNGKAVVPERVGQFASGISGWASTPKMALFFANVYYPLLNKDGSKVVATFQAIASPLRQAQAGESGFEFDLNIASLPENARVQLSLVDDSTAQASVWDPTTSTLKLPGNSDATIRLKSEKPLKWNTDGSITVDTETFAGLDTSLALVQVEYRTHLPVDQYIVAEQPLMASEAVALDIVPGLKAVRLPLPIDIMPTGFAWKPDGSLVFTSLKGQVSSARDTNSDGVEDEMETLVDGLATPYGVAIPQGRDDRVDVATKTGLTRLMFSSREGSPTICNDLSDWGRTDDYHDWAIGPIPGENGEYFIALPCEQDQRSEAAARYRGKLLKLVPRLSTPDNPRRYDLEVISSGHRFPMGMARNRDGELFVTDNQGNYNPFNELNHVRKGAHFGFINALEKEQGFKPPPLAEPAINIPHPWTRSVNGICFLETPSQLLAGTKPGPGAPGASLLPANGGSSIFGPLEGHLVGCEYDTRRLIRMTLDKVGGEYQGAAYPLSIPPADVEKGLLGPIVCAVKPTTGELYVGEIRDSGWGAGNNIGQIVKIKIEPEKLPCGIAEVKATPTGFTVDFFQPVDSKLAADLASYSLASYRRESTPAYGGPDIDRREEQISTAAVSSDAKRVTLTLEGLRAGHVYELRVKNLTPGGGTFHPDEAHYTLRKIPQ